MTKRVLIFGAGAIGRGFLGPLLSRYDISVSFVETDSTLADHLKSRSSYKAAITKGDHYEIVDVPISEAFHLEEDFDVASYDLVFSCVGPNNCYSLADKLKEAKAVISCENDDTSAKKLRQLSGNEAIYFGIPDVITSNTASAELLAADPLTTITEQGVLVLEKGSYSLPNAISQLEKDELLMHWMCKLFIHNAPHAIVAYLGWLKRYRYIHEAMADPAIAEVVVGSISEITDGIIGAGFATRDFATMYKEKELSRFRNCLLFDTVERVAREPIRKIGKDNRIILGMRLALYNGVKPKYTAIGAKAALVYNNPADKEATYLQQLRASIGAAQILKDYAGIELYDPLNRYILDQDIADFNVRRSLSQDPIAKDSIHGGK